MDIKDAEGKGGISVRVGHSVVVETDVRSVQPPSSPRSTTTPKSEFEDAGHIGNGLDRTSGHKSTEDLVERDVSFSA
jgi:hypothetical protein